TVGQECAIQGEQVKGLTEGLRQQQAIEGVGVVKRQGGHRGRMPRGDGQFVKAACLDRGGWRLRVPLDLSEACLDGYLPDGGRRHVDRFGCRDPRARGWAQTAVSAYCPEKQVGVEQDLQSPPSKAARTCSGNGASKSSATLILPLRIPKRTRRFGAASRVKRATGLPPRAMMTSSPAAARSTSFESVVLAW